MGQRRSQLLKSLNEGNYDIIVRWNTFYSDAILNLKLTQIQFIQSTSTLILAFEAFLISKSDNLNLYFWMSFGISIFLIVLTSMLVREEIDTTSNTLGELNIEMQTRYSRQQEIIERAADSDEEITPELFDQDTPTYLSNSESYLGELINILFIYMVISGAYFLVGSVHPILFLPNYLVMTSIHAIIAFVLGMYGLATYLVIALSKVMRLFKNPRII